jgi:hypothetical protein
LHPVFEQKGIAFVIPAQPHHLDLFVAPTVHADGPNEANMNAQCPVPTATFEAHKDPQADRRPLRNFAITITAYLAG